MIFCSYEFLFLFLPLVLLGYYTLFARWGRTAFLTVTSYVFYGWWDYRFCGLLLASTLIDYYCGQQLWRAGERRVARRWLMASMTSNLLMLGFFKYFDLGAATINALVSALGSQHPAVPLLHMVLPVGISFYTFQTMSYCIDLYRGEARPARDLWTFACYVALFPQLVAGPIVRYHELAEQLNARTHSLSRMARGSVIFVIGLAKKVLLADAAAPLVRLAFGERSPGLLDGWVGVLAYTIQIYYDFSGYSDMAVGLGLMFGFTFPINFNSPYQAVSITDFWRRWHISLSSWLRDYLYIALGGNRISPLRTYINLFLVMLLGGLWHGANWTFVVWGAYHGVLLAVERLVGVRAKDERGALYRMSTFLLVTMGWVVFRATSMSEACRVWSGLLGLNGLGGLNSYSCNFPLSGGLLLLACASLAAWFLPNSWNVLKPCEDGHERPFGSSLISAAMASFVVIALFLVCVGVLLVNTSSPFLYFQF